MLRGDYIVTMRPTLKAVEEYLEQIIEDAKVQFKVHLDVEDNKRQKIRLIMLGTAGMRNLCCQAKETPLSLEREINLYLRNKCVFETSEEPYTTISGKEEAAYSWIAANFSLRTFTALGQESPCSLGYLEMGELLGEGDITRVTLGDKHFDLFLKTYDLGSNKAWEEYQKDLPRHSRMDENGMHGEFDAVQFEMEVARILDRLAPPRNPGGSRLLDGNLVKALKASRFHKKSVFRFEEYEAEVHRTTMLSWPLLQLRLRHRDEEVMGKAWFSAETEDELSFRPYNGPNGKGLTWTLGKMVQFVTGDKAVQSKLTLQCVQDAPGCLRRNLRCVADKVMKVTDDDVSERVCEAVNKMTEAAEELEGRDNKLEKRINNEVKSMWGKAKKAKAKAEIKAKIDEEKKKIQEAIAAVRRAALPPAYFAKPPSLKFVFSPKVIAFALARKYSPSTRIPTRMASGLSSFNSRVAKPKNGPPYPKWYTWVVNFEIAAWKRCVKMTLSSFGRMKITCLCVRNKGLSGIPSLTFLNRE
ncbi:hypothetical protein GYMLUDRAFT_240959 [Collybiopsis luxurians FD-317 M1]|nr:hypothetical protein GYMLUDRAFT_240959 [Collybiopsis luxurians FD-317 M1]